MKFFIAAAFLALSSVAYADEHTIDMTKPIIDEKGKPAIDGLEATKEDPECKHCPVLTIGTAVAHALNATYNDEAQIPNIGDIKWRRSLIAERIRDSKSATLNAKEAATIHTLVGKFWPGLVIMQIMPVVDPNAKPPEL